MRRRPARSNASRNWLERLAEVQAVLFDYIEVFYNRQRLHSTPRSSRAPLRSNWPATDAKEEKPNNQKQKPGSHTIVRRVLFGTSKLCAVDTSIISYKILLLTVRFFEGSTDF